MGSENLVVHYNEITESINNVTYWRYRFEDLKNDIIRRFNCCEEAFGNLKISCQTGEVRFYIDDNSSLTRCLMLGGSNIDLYILGEMKFNVEEGLTRNDLEDNVTGLDVAIDIDEFGEKDENVDVSIDNIEGVSDADCEFSSEEGSSSCDGSLTSENGGEEDFGDGFSNIDSDGDELEHVIEDLELEGQLRQINKMNAGIWFEKEVNGSIKLCVGQLFNDVYHFREILKEFIIQEGFEVIRVKNEKSRVTVKCKAEGCLWRVHASPTSDGQTYKIKSYRGKHSCLSQSRFKEATYAWIATKLRDKFEVDPNKSKAAISRDLIDMFGITGLNPMKLYRAREKARKMIFGDHKEQFALLRAYGELVLEHNPSSVFVVTPYERDTIDRPIIFKRMVIMFDGVRHAFLEGCRPYLGVDGCFLKGPYGGVLLTVVALDGNNGIVPLALCVAETESKDSWLYFFNLLRDAIGDNMDGVPWTIMSDRQKRLVDAIQLIFPTVVQRYCLFHVQSNFKVKFRGARLKNKMTDAGKSSNLRTFTQNMEWIRMENSNAHAWLEKIPKYLWSRHAYNTVSKVDHVTNNAAESLNSWLNDNRDLPILSLLEAFRLKVMNRFHSRFQRATQWNGKLVPNVTKRLNSEWSSARKFEVFGAGQHEYQVKVGSLLFTVNLNNWTCSCGRWMVSGVPCMHAIASIRSNNEEVESYCHEAFTVSTYFKVYRHIIHPQPDIGVLSMPQGEQMQPPPLRRQAGRPRKARRLHPAEKMGSQRSTSLRCSNCKEVGHNIRGCQRAKVNTNQRTSNIPENDISATQYVASSSQMDGQSELGTKVGSIVKETGGMRPKLKIRSKGKRG